MVWRACALLCARRTLPLQTTVHAHLACAAALPRCHARRYYWWQLAFELISLIGLAVLMAAGLLAASALSWLAWFTVLTLLWMQVREARTRTCMHAGCLHPRQRRLAPAAPAVLASCRRRNQASLAAAALARRAPQGSDSFLGLQKLAYGSVIVSDARSTQPAACSTACACAVLVAARLARA